ncbi:MAG: VOC family protein [Solirubrobacterales bacterium]
MDWKIELIGVPVSNADRSLEFYGALGFNLDHDHKVSDDIRFIQMTPPGSACSIAFGKGITEMEPGSLDNMQVVVADADEARQFLLDNGVETGEVQEFPWGRFVFFSDPDGNGWALQQIVTPG